MKCTFVLIAYVIGINHVLTANIPKSSVNDLVHQMSVKRQNCEYVCEDEYHDDISTLTAKIDLLSSNHNKLENNVNSLTSKVDSQYSELKGGITTLTNNYNSHTVRKCLTGYKYQVCDPHCAKKGQDWPNGVATTVTFSSPFHKTPSVIISLQRFDDYGNSAIRSDYWVNSASSSQFTFTMKTYQDSRMTYANMAWMACA